MAHSLKRVRYKDHRTKILLQNENGPCPLLAAANALLLQGIITLPSHAVRQNVASLDDVVNMLAERALAKYAVIGNENENEKAETQHHIDELLKLFPSLQYGMDVNPKFTMGPSGVEYTIGLGAFDILGLELFHGWLVDPQDIETGEVIGAKTYNELVEMMINGNDASAELATLDNNIKELEALIEATTTTTENKTNEVNTDTESGENEFVHITNEVGTEAEDEVKEEVSIEKDSSSTVETNLNEASKEEAQDSHDTQEEQNEPNSTSLPIEVETEEGDEIREAVGDEKESSFAVETDSNQDGKEEAQDGDDTQEEPTSLQNELQKLQEKHKKQSKIFRDGLVIDEFLKATSTQLSFSGLAELHNHMKEGQLGVFFRNNHFSTITKYEGILYLLVTDLGYINTPGVMWERLDDVSGDTEYAGQDFIKTPPRTDIAPVPGSSLSPEQMLAQSSRAEADYQLAIQLSQNQNGQTQSTLDDREGQMVAAATEASLREWNSTNGTTRTTNDGTAVDIPERNEENQSSPGQQQGTESEKSDMMMARQLQAQYDSHAQQQQQQQRMQQQRMQRERRAQKSCKDSSCAIS